MPEPLIIKLQTLTPLWTGGVEAGRMDCIHETGIIGGLRWWYEAIIRGLGGNACDPSQHACSYDHDRPDNVLCDVCQIFGATGWRRRFRLEISDHVEPAWTSGRTLNLRPYGRQRGWYLNPGLVGSGAVTITGDSDSLARLAAMFRFMEAWGTLGARPQLGYGLFRITNPDAVPESFPWEAHGSSAIGSLPDLRTFIFFKLRFTPREATWWTQVSGIRELRSQPDLWSILERLAEHGMVPVAPAIKNYLRFELAWSSVSLKRWLFGTLEGNVRIRSKVSLSWAYRLDHGDEWEIRGWVYVPQDATGRYAREEIAQTLQRALEHPQSWFRAIGLDAGYRYPAEVTIMPAPALVSGQTWRLQTTSQIATFLSSLPAAR